MSADEAWSELKRTEAAMVQARMAFMATDWGPVLRRALETWDGVPTALGLLRILPRERVEPFAGGLLAMAVVTHGQIGIVRELLASLGPGWMSANARGFVEDTIASPDATDEQFRRLAELLRELDELELLTLVVAAAAESEDPDIREVAEDFR